MRPPLQPEVQAALVDYMDARKQETYRWKLMVECEQDLRNKSSDYVIAQQKSDDAHRALLRVCTP